MPVKQTNIKVKENCIRKAVWKSVVYRWKEQRKMSVLLGPAVVAAPSANQAACQSEKPVSRRCCADYYCS